MVKLDFDEVVEHFGTEGNYNRDGIHREWWAGGVWLYPGDVVVVLNKKQWEQIKEKSNG